MGSIAHHGEKRRERKTPMDFDNLEIIWDLLRIVARRGRKICPMNLDHFEFRNYLKTKDSSRTLSDQGSSHQLIRHFVLGC
jgi:hypothetical protein